MPINRKIDNQTRAMLLATTVSAIVASGAMFVPVQIWETVTGATGISEMIPATAAPLGDRARALIAFALAAGCFLLLSAQALRGQRPASAPRVKDLDDAYPHAGQPFAPLAQEEESTPKPSLLARLREKLGAHLEARRAYAGITTLDDLPKLRAGDAHPDAPPRRPFSAERDLAEPVGDRMAGPAAVAEEPAVMTVPAPNSGAMADPDLDPSAEDINDAPEEAMPLVDDSLEPGLEAELIEAAAAAESGEEAMPMELPQPGMAAMAEMPVLDTFESALQQPQNVETIAETGSAADAPLGVIVDRLEAALDARDAQLARVEALALELSAASASEEQPPAAAEVLPVAAVRTVLEAVPDSNSSSQQAEEMDPALRSALDTLHRMSARSR